MIISELSNETDVMKQRASVKSIKELQRLLGQKQTRPTVLDYVCDR